MINPKQRRFVDAYLRLWNGAQAAREAEYSEKSIYSIAYELLRKPEIQEEINRRLTSTAMSADEVLERLGQHARGSLATFLSGDGETIDLTTAEAQSNLHLVKKFKVKKRMGGESGHEWTEVETEIELYDSQGALVQLGRHHKLFTDKVEIPNLDAAIERELARLAGRSETENAGAPPADANAPGEPGQA